MHSKAPWQATESTNDYESHVLYSATRPVATTVMETSSDVTKEDENNAALIALAPEAPHDCEIPDCPGMANKRLLEAAEGLLDIIKRAEYTIDGPVGDLLTGDQMAETGAYDWLALAQEALAAATGGGE